MKMSFLRKLSAVMTLLVLFVMVQPVSFVRASTADVTLMDDITSLRFSNFSTSHGTTTAGQLTVEKEYADSILNKNVLRYSSTAYADGNSMYHKAAREARLYVLGTSGSNTFTETLYNANNHKYVKLQYKLYIENATDGLAFRINRYNIGEEDVLTLDGTTGYYFAVGGSDFVDSECANANQTTGYSYTYRGLITGSWHDVIIELGADTTTNTIKFFIDENQVNVTEVKHTYNTSTSKVDKETTSPATNVYTFPANTCGFGGRSENYAVLVPKGTKGTADAPNPFGIRISDCKIVATNTKVDTEKYNASPVVVYTLDSQKTMTRATENNLTTEYIQAPHFANEFSKSVLHIQSGTGGYATGSNYTAGNYTDAAKAPVYSLVSKANDTIGNIDYSKYKYLRTSFNVYLNHEANGIYIKADRLLDGTITNAHNFIFEVGASKYNSLSAKSMRHVHTNKDLTVGRWHNVVIELGSNAGNATINYYIDGKLAEFKYGEVVDDVADMTFATETSLYGWGGASTSRCGIVPKSNYGEVLDLYLSDFVMTATNDKYTTPAEIKILSSKVSSIKVEDGKVYTYGALSNGECSSLFEVVGADYVGVLENGKLIMLYNSETDSIRYYDVVTVTDSDIKYTSGLHVDNLEVASGDSYADIKATAYNLTEDYTKKVKLIVTYFKDGLLTECFTKDISLGGKLCYVNEKITRKTASYDTVKAFVWTDLNTMEILGEYAQEIK